MFEERGWIDLLIVPARRLARGMLRGEHTGWQLQHRECSGEPSSLWYG